MLWPWLSLSLCLVISSHLTYFVLFYFIGSDDLSHLELQLSVLFVVIWFSFFIHLFVWCVFARCAILSFNFFFSLFILENNHVDFNFLTAFAWDAYYLVWCCMCEQQRQGIHSNGKLMCRKCYRITTWHMQCNWPANSHSIGDERSIRSGLNCGRSPNNDEIESTDKRNVLIILRNK